MLIQTDLFEELSDADLTSVVGGRILGLQGELSPGFYSVESIINLDANSPLGEGTFLAGATPIVKAGVGGGGGFLVEVTKDGTIKTDTSF